MQRWKVVSRIAPKKVVRDTSGPRLQGRRAVSPEVIAALAGDRFRLIRVSARRRRCRIWDRPEARRWWEARNYLAR